MSLPNELLPVGLLGTGAAGGYQIERSLRFNSTDSAYLSRTPGSAGNRKTWTWAGWVKRSALGRKNLFMSYNGSTLSESTYTNLSFSSANVLNFGSAFVTYRSTTQVFRDPSAWYHIVVALDTTQATAGDRVKIYVNGAQVTAFNTTNNPSLNADLAVNATFGHRLGSEFNQFYFDGYLADIHFIDGQALDPTSFGEFDTNNVWQPIQYQGEYGTNGFHLPLSDNSTAAALGTDDSGNDNTWTVNNISVAAGAGNDSLVDSPTNGSQTDTGVGGEVVGNYCTLNTLSIDGGTTLSNGNLDLSSANYGNNTATFFLTSGKWYWEGIGVGYVAAICGKAGQNWGTSIGNTGSNSIGWWYIGPVYWDGGNNGGGTGYSSSDVVGTALDMDSGVVYFYKNGTLTYTITFGSGTIPDLSDGVFPCYNNGASTGTKTATYNFGQRPFAYTAPEGFKALCTTNLPEPTISDGSQYMDVKLYTGNGSTQTISGLGFSPDLVWIKNRAQADNHKLLDAIRGATNELESNTTDAEVANADGLTAFNSDGFDLGADVEYNTSSEAYVAWTWDAGSSTVTNEDGTITSQVRANASAGFSIVSWTASGTDNDSVGHGLNAKPEFFVLKSRDGARDWLAYTQQIDGSLDYLILNSLAAAANSSAIAPTSSVFYVIGSNVNPAGEDMIAYCFAPVAGYSAFGSYTGNGSADGPFVYTGMRPRFILVKLTSAVDKSWRIFDTERDTYNLATKKLYPNVSNAEADSSADSLDILSNGFKFRGGDGGVNGSGNTYIYLAFAENPFQYARAR